MHARQDMASANMAHYDSLLEGVDFPPQPALPFGAMEALVRRLLSMDSRVTFSSRGKSVVCWISETGCARAAPQALNADAEDGMFDDADD